MRILLAIDDSECSIAAVKAVIEQFRPAHTQITVLHADDWPGGRDRSRCLLALAVSRPSDPETWHHGLAMEPARKASTGERRARQRIGPFMQAYHAESHDQVPVEAAERHTDNRCNPIAGMGHRLSGGCGTG